MVDQPCCVEACRRTGIVTVGHGTTAAYCIRHIPEAIERLQQLHARYLTLHAHEVPR